MSKEQALGRAARTSGIVLRFEEKRAEGLSEVTIYAGSAEPGEQSATVHECGKMILETDVWQAMLQAMDQEGDVIDKGCSYHCLACGKTHQLEGSLEPETCPTCGFGLN